MDSLARKIFEHLAMPNIFTSVNSKSLKVNKKWTVSILLQEMRVTYSLKFVDSCSLHVS